MRTMFLACVTVLAALPSLAMAQLNVDKSVLELTNQSQRSTVRLSNSGKDTLYINLKLLEVTNPEADSPTKTPLVDPTKDGILVHPRQIILEPGQARSARVVLNQPVTDQDRVFRLKLEPLAGDALQNDDAERTAGVRMLLGYQLLVLARPDTLAPDIELQRQADSIVFLNHGNTSVLLRQLEVCATNGSNCSPLQPNRLYPNEVRAFAMPEGINGQTALIRTRQSVQASEELVEYSP